jgi:RNA 2',3'-cyclic 3'-phosphodiesterase
MGSATPSVERNHARVFFALWPDADTRRRLAQAAARLQAACGGRMPKPDNIHLTLVFLGDVAREQLNALRKAADAVTTRVHTLTLERFGWFRRNRVAWAAPARTPPDLLELVQELEAALRQAGFRFDARPYEAHITLGRKANCGELPALPESIDWLVREFVLVESVLGEAGSTYSIIGRWPLRSADRPESRN